MRRSVYKGEKKEAVELLRRSPFVRVVGSDEAGRPVLKVVHGVVLGDHLVFHGADAGEKTVLIGSEVLVSAEEIVAEIPSYFVDPERACPATTYYRSAQVRGVLEKVEGLEEKAAALQALMERFQGEGGYEPIRADHPLYARVVEKILVCRVSLEGVVSKVKMGQNKKPKKMKAILEGLWKRGESGDARALEELKLANSRECIPDFLRIMEGMELVCEVFREEDFVKAAEILEGVYWRLGESVSEIAGSLRRSSACVGARDLESGTLIAFVRAVSDWSRSVWVYDLVVDERWREKGVGGAVMRLLLEHPEVRNAKRVFLGTRDAQGFYLKMGFEERNPEGAPTVMWRRGGL